MLVAKDVSARGARIRFAEGGSGAPLVLLHDFGASHATYASVASILAESFHVIAPDFPGFGGSEKPDPQRYAYGYDAFAESVFDVVAALGLGRVHVCGHGMGAGVALTLAAKHSAIVYKLVLVSALVYPGNEHALERAGRVPVLGGLLWKQLMGQALYRTYLTGTVHAGAKHVTEGRLDAHFREFNTPAARQAAHATLIAKADTRPLVARLPRVAADALVIWGRDDGISPVEHGRRLARELRARFEVLECGRCPPDEEPEAFATTLTAFLEAVPSRRVRSAPASVR